MVKWTVVLICGRLYITDYSQGEIIFENQTRMVFNEVLEKYLRIPLFPGQRRKKMGGFRFWIESDAQGVSFCFRSL